MLTSTRFMGLDCVRIANAALSLLVTRTTGPRILGLRLHNQESLFAELPDFAIGPPGARQLTLWGGHRLWHAPEMARRTYLPDTAPPEIVETGSGLLITQPLETATGLQKSMLVALPGDGATVVVDHRFTNQGLWPVTCALWAITQLKVGGLAILPQVQGATDADGLLPNRHLALWPYSDVRSPALTWGNRCLLLRATLAEGAFKVGFANPRGWLAYLHGRTLFVKRARFYPDQAYYDGGSSCECYCNDRFLELETLSPVVTIPPGGSASHREVWELHGGVPPVADEAGAAALAADYGLDQESEFLQEKPVL